MMAMARPDPRAGRTDPAEVYRRQRGKNWLVFGLLLGFVVLVFLLSIVRMGGSQ
jgi:hypothetical protein